MSTLMWDRCELATFFKDMIIRLIIIGINLSRSKVISRGLVVMRARSILHCVAPADGKPRKVISEEKGTDWSDIACDDGLHDGYPPYDWLGKLSVRVELRHWCKEPYPHCGIRDHDQQMARSYCREVYFRVPADRIENVRHIHPSVSRFEDSDLCEDEHENHDV